MTKERRMDNIEWPEWLNRAWNKHEMRAGAVFRQNMDAPLPDLLCIQTLEGTHLVQWGDWIIRGVQGEVVPMQAGHFRGHIRSGLTDMTLAFPNTSTSAARPCWKPAGNCLASTAECRTAPYAPPTRTGRRTAKQGHQGR